MAMAETLSGTYGPHRIEVELCMPDSQKAELQLTLFIDGQVADRTPVNVFRSRLGSSLSGVLPGQAEKLVEVSAKLGHLSSGSYTVHADGHPVPMAIRRGRRHETPD